MKHLFISVVACLPTALAGLGDRQSIWDFKRAAEARRLEARDTNPALLYPTYNLSVPVDHFHNDSSYEPHSDGTFPLRYWFSAEHYKAGGPVIILQSGETSGVGRLPYLQKGILQKLIAATNGIGVVLEHRYYGESWPVPDLSVDNLRFLTTDQALADEAYFARNVVFPGLEHLDLTSKTTPYITYGGSYAGAFVAFLRKLYPDVFWGAISSSGVPEAIWDYWQYFSPIAEYGPSDCIEAQRTVVDVMDTILLKRNSTNLTKDLKNLFGLGNLTHDDDFASLVTTSGIYNWQSLNWDPAVTSNAFYTYCDKLTNSSLTYPATASKQKDAAKLIRAAGKAPKSTSVTTLLNVVGYLNSTVQGCNGGQTQDECFGSRNPDFYSQDDLSQDWRSWPYQYCTEWGYLQTGSGTPANQRPIVSRAITLEYSSIICEEAFNITSPPDVDRINKFGGYNISYPRLAFVDGEWDAWRPAGVHAFEQGALKREDTVDEPFKLIPKAGHHWDENGVFANQTNSTFPPADIRAIQSQEVDFVKAWLEEYKQVKMEKARPFRGSRQMKVA